MSRSPDYDPNQFEATLEAFRRYGSYFHREEERFYFDIEENEEAKVELEAYRSGAMRPRDSRSAKSGLEISSKSRSKR